MLLDIFFFGCQLDVGWMGYHMTSDCFCLAHTRSFDSFYLLFPRISGCKAPIVLTVLSEAIGDAQLMGSLYGCV